MSEHPGRPLAEGGVWGSYVRYLSSQARILRTVAAHIGALGSVDEAAKWLTAEAEKSQRMADEAADAAWDRKEPAEPTQKGAPNER